MFQNLTKTAAVVVSSTILATLAVNAVDMRGYFVSTMLGGLFFSVQDKKTDVCPENMKLVEEALNPFCVDMYENSTNENCIYENPENEDETIINLSSPKCFSVSEPSRKPWTNITVEEAKKACESAGKRLPTASEWYKSAIGTPDTNFGWNEETCNVAHNREDGVAKTGGGMRCISDVGAYDMVGNVWEWVSETVNNGEFNGEILPETGFVSEVDFNGIAHKTSPVATDEKFNNDRFWMDNSIVAGMMRGGYYGSQTQAGLYSIYAASSPTFSGDAVGFRCVSDPNI
jgi:formylglycine-generating enzyme required for sulfatase activity